MDYVITSNGVLMRADEFYHHGIKGQKWGVRRYQNPDGSLTALGKKRQEKRVASDREATIVKGTTLYRISDSDKSDTSDGKIYVSATKDSGDYYVKALGSGKIYNKGKAYTHQYIANVDLKMPDKRTLEKIELGLLKDKNVQKELVDSLMKKGISREQATEQVRAYSAGKAFAEKMGIVGVYSLVGGAYGLAAGPVGAGIGAATGALTGLGIASTVNIERSRALNAVRTSYGDKNNKITNDTLAAELSKRGYNAMKDYNDRRAFGKKGEQAIVVFDSNKNLRNSKITEVTAKDYARAYAKNYQKEHPKSTLDFDDLMKDGEAEYKRLYESGVINREREKENQRLLEQAKKKSK